MTITPPRNHTQQLAALATANETRYRRANLKTNLRRHSLPLAAIIAADIIERPPPWAQTMKTRNLLVALPTIGDAKADRALIQLRINPRKTISGLSDRQRTELTRWLNQRATT